MQAIATFKVADMVPANGRVSFVDIAKATPMTEQMTARLLRHAMTMRIFCEPEPGMVAHTAASKILRHSAANDWLQAGTEEMWPAATKVSEIGTWEDLVADAKCCSCQMIEALAKWPASEEPNETVRPPTECIGTAVITDASSKRATHSQRIVLRQSTRCFRRILSGPHGGQEACRFSPKGLSSTCRMSSITMIGNPLGAL